MDYISEADFEVNDSWSIYNVATQRTPKGWKLCFYESDAELKHISRVIETKYKKKGLIRPAMKDVFKAFWYTDLNKVKVVIIGQDPYPNNNAVGLSFSGLPGSKIPVSLENVFKEVQNTIEGFVMPNDGDLRGWALQGVLLLNMSLTIFDDVPGSHDEIWDGFILNVVKSINAANPNTVYIIWGSKAERIKTFIEKNPFIQGGHPSSNNINGGFFGLDYFNKANQILAKNGIKGIDWTKTSLESIKNMDKSFFQFDDISAKIKFEEEEKKKKDEKNHLNDFMKAKLLRAFQENRLEEIKKSKINITCMKNWAKEYQIKIPSGMNREKVIIYIHSQIQKGLVAKSDYSSYFSIDDYNHDPSEWYIHFMDEGFAVTNLDGYEENAIDHFFNWMKSCNPSFSKEDSKTWIHFKGYNKHYIAQTEFLWKLRELAYPYFVQIWKRKNLLCSFEGVQFNYNDSKDISINKIQGEQLLNSDQNIKTFSCIRAVIFLTECNEFVFLKKSRNTFCDFIEAKQNKARVGDPMFKDFERIRITCKAGDILIFDARMFYFQLEQPNTKCIYTWVSMIPSDEILKTEIKRRISCYERGVSTNHWCYGNEFKSCSEHKFKKLVIDTENKPNKVEIAELNDLRSKLIGY